MVESHLKWVENTGGKGEIARCFPKVSLKHFYCRRVKTRDCLGKVNPFPNKPWFLRVCSTSLLKTL